MRSLFVLIVLVAIIEVTFSYPRNTDMLPKRDIKPDWEDLGWAWGKRSSPDSTFPRRFLRSMQLVKKTPDWHDLGWTWGRR
ncbi:unnamed protein product [Cylicocyclus nassatus]|uniref:Uncharacterized protein n=1 Tax=Cylicocyclus nassatus TaxID=53992 RepID=A0AA36GGZ0_CYLNA|nr:unnamed protein product [Cylicocyclus nassatus]